MLSEGFIGIAFVDNDSRKLHVLNSRQKVPKTISVVLLLEVKHEEIEFP